MSRTIPLWNRPHRGLRRPSTQLDKIALVPASELASLIHWQEKALQLPTCEILVVVPSGNLRLQQVGCQIEASLAKRGLRSCVATINTTGKTL